MASFALAVGILSILTAVFCFVMAGVVLVAAPSRATNRALAALLFINGFQTLPAVFGTFVDDRTLDYYALFSLPATLPIYLAVYPWFLGCALDTPWTRFLRRRVAKILLAELMVFGILLTLVVPRHTLAGPGIHHTDIGWTWESGPIFVGMLALLIPLSAFGIIAAVSALRRAQPGTPARRQAKAYLWAFATQDLGIVVVTAYLLYDPTALILWNAGTALAVLASSVLIAAALLRTQLFDFDLKLKIGLTKGTVAAIFLGTFFVVAAIAQQYLQQYGFIAGGIAVGFLLLAFVPIQRAAASMADRVLPGVSDDTGYLMRKKVEVYQVALHDAMQPGGGLEPSRADTLRKLRSSLGLTQRDHEMLLSAALGEAATRRMVAVVPGATVLGKYRVERELGAGGGGRAFLAQDVRMDRKVVLKTVSGGDPSAAMREARAAAAIEHPNVVQVFDVEDLGKEALIVMEHVDGGSLKDRLSASGALSDAAFARVANDVLAALEAVHAADAIHRDIKPGNILLTRTGRAKLSDFGIARLPGYEATMGHSQNGSIQYMSPEQARGKRVTRLSDLYSSAATLYEARTGQPLVEPMPDESAPEMQMRIGAGRTFDENLQPPALRAWFTRALAASPERRFQSALEMREALVAALAVPTAS